MQYHSLSTCLGVLDPHDGEILALTNQYWQSCVWLSMTRLYCMHPPRHAGNE